MTSHLRKGLMCCLIGILLCVAVGIGAISTGTYPVPPATTAAILWHKMLNAIGLSNPPSQPAWTALQETIVWTIRAPRVLVAGFVGAGLAFAGTLMQGLFRNPLASPGILGVSSGGALGAVICIVVGWSASSIWPLPACAFAGAFITILTVYALASYQGDTPVATLLLAGIAVAALAGSATSFLIVMSARHDWHVAREILFWTLGGLDARRWEHVAIVVPPVGFAVCASSLFLRDLNIMLLGEEQARTLGVDTHRLKLVLLAITSLATGAAVAVSGLVAFVGLVIPHMLRMLTGPDHRVLVPASLLGGAVFLMFTDTAVRALAPAELRLGIVTGALGAPFFLFLLLRQRNRVVHL